MVNMLCATSVVILLLGLAYSDPIHYRDCGTAGLQNIIFDVSDCSKFPCILKRGSTITLKLHATANQSFKRLKNLAFGTIAGVKVPFPLPQADACANGVTCPVLNGTDLSETISLSILNVYPTLSVLVEFHLADEAGKTVFCGVFPAKIQ